MFNMESRHLLNLSLQNTLDCIKREPREKDCSLWIASKRTSISKHFPGGAFARNSLEVCAVRSPDGCYVYYISRLPLSQNPSSAPVYGRPGLIGSWFLVTHFWSRSFFTAVDGGFSKWTPFSACSVTCGSGVKVRTRTCTNPPRQWEGKDCVGARQESMACNEGPCKWYINPWSLNKGGKTIIWKAACSQRSRLVETRWRRYSWKIRVGTRGVLSGIVNLLDKNKKCDFPTLLVQTKNYHKFQPLLPKRTNTYPISHPRR